MDTTITLQQGLEQFQAKNQKYFSKRNTSAKVEEFLRNHDVAHVVFGCDTSLYGEGVVKIWTTFGTTLSFWKVPGGYYEVNAFHLFRRYSFRHIMNNILRFLCSIPKTIFRAKRMSKPWPFSNYQSYLDKSISEIRTEFNIQILEDRS
jgi:ubiquinone biosynthesis protein Coq4